MVRNKRKAVCFLRSHCHCHIDQNCRLISIRYLNSLKTFSLLVNTILSLSFKTHKSSGVIGLRLTLVEQGDFEQLCKLFNIYFKLYS